MKNSVIDLTNLLEAFNRKLIKSKEGSNEVEDSSY
jgi:hypothetical protein